MTEKLSRTGELARAAGVNVETFRYHERRGIVAQPGRRQSGYRAYPEEAVRVVRFVRRAKRALVVLVDSWVDGASVRECPILEAVDDREPRRRA